MRILSSFALVAAVSLVPSLARAAELPTVAFTPPDEVALAIPITVEPASYARPTQDSDVELTATRRCSRTRLGGRDVIMAWKLSQAQSEVQRVDVTKFPNGFQSGDYLTSGERPAADRGLMFEEPEPGIFYYWRLMTKTPGGWVVRGTGRAQAPICPVDGIKE